VNNRTWNGQLIISEEWHLYEAGVCVCHVVIVYEVLYQMLRLPVGAQMQFQNVIKISQWIYEGVSKSFRTGRLERELQMIQLSATRCSCIAILWVSLVNFAAIAICAASQQVFIIVVVCFDIDSVRKLWIHPPIKLRSQLLQLFIAFLFVNPVYLFTPLMLGLIWVFLVITVHTKVYPKVSGLAAWSENWKWYTALCHVAVVSIFCESV
jgi:hypothetical protein